MRTYILLGVIFFVSLKTISQVTLSGNAPSFAGIELVFEKYSDPFTGNEVELGRCKVAANGNFLVSFSVNEITYIFSHMGIYKGYMYIEPGKSYVISFPDKTDKSQAENLNPFYEEIEFQFAIKNISSSDLNFLLLSYNDSYEPYLSKFARNFYSRNKKALLDSTVTALKNLNTGSDVNFYKDYVFYKTGYIKNLAYQQRAKSISKEYFQSKPVLYSNPAYVELFNQTYSKYFYFFGRTSSGKKIFDDVNRNKSYYQLTQTLLQDSILNGDTLRELVILKNIHDEFYSDKFSRSGLLVILDSLACLTKIEKHKEIASFIKKKITRLMPGFCPPDFDLLDKDNKLVKLSGFSGKYVYLNFCSCSSYACLKEFDLLKRMAEKYKDKLVIVTIAVDDTWEMMVDFLNNSEYNWNFLHYGNQPKVIEDYDIRAYPTYFLVGPDGKLIYSPAASPAENFELYLFKVMRSRNDI
jgi:thiol-disulfide isomerase/thioredoxin